MKGVAFEKMGLLGIGMVCDLFREDETPRSEGECEDKTTDKKPRVRGGYDAIVFISHRDAAGKRVYHGPTVDFSAGAHFDYYPFSIERAPAAITIIHCPEDKMVELMFRKTVW